MKEKPKREPGMPIPPKRGQPLKSKEGKRRQLRINFSPPNYEFITNMNGGGHDYLNNLLDLERGKVLEQQ